jgi:hypothetical protein
MMVIVFGDKMHPVHETHRPLQTRMDDDDPSLFLSQLFKPAD